MRTMNNGGVVEAVNIPACQGRGQHRGREHAAGPYTVTLKITFKPDEAD